MQRIHLSVWRQSPWLGHGRQREAYCRALAGGARLLEFTPHWAKVTCKSCLKKRVKTKMRWSPRAGGMVRA